MSSTDELARLRAEMDALNRELLQLLQRRARLVRRIGEHKQRQGLPLVDVRRERAMLRELLRDPGEGFDRDALRQILASLFAASRALLQQPHR